MVVKHLFGIILILNLSIISAQDIDSLSLVSFKLSSDTERVNLFYKEGFANRAIDPQYSYACAKLAEKFAQQSSSPYFIAKSSNLLGILYYRKQDLIKALSYHKKALNLRTIINDKKGIAMSETNLGNIYTDLKKYALAEKAYLKALNTNNELNQSKQIGNCLLNLGVLKANEGSPSKDTIILFQAKNYFELALQNAKQRIDYELEAQCYNNLAVINMDYQKYDDAIANCWNSIKIKNLMDNEIEMADSYLNIALCWLKKHELKTTDEFLLKADSIINKYDYTEARVQALKIRSDYFMTQKNYESAYQFLGRHHFIRDSINQLVKERNLQNNFVEEFLFEKEKSKHAFPYIYLNILILVSILCIGFVLKFKK